MPTQPHIIDFLVDRIFKYTSLRQAVTDEVHFYDMIQERLKDTTPGSAFWNDGDGWRSWTYSAGRNKYYFNDIPVDNLGEAMRYSFESLGPEFDLDEVW
jgi:hypothetical protein